MNYEETIAYLYQSAPMFQQIGSKAYKEGLDNTLAIDTHLGHPHQRFRTIHVGGTNGKGSTSHTIASVLMESGYKTGLYTSPHLLDFRERIKINGQMINQDFVVDFIAENKAFFKKLDASFFELTTAMAFAYFAKEKVDVAVIEVGLGGRLDCTNIIRPDLSIITNISFDHMAQLGNTLTAIAKEKAGIIKPGIPVVIGEAEGEVKQLFIDKAKDRSPIIFTEEEKPILEGKQQTSNDERPGWFFRTKNDAALFYELGGLAQEKNAATILCAIDELKKSGYKIPDEAVKAGTSRIIENTGLQGRWQIIQKYPKMVFDTGHNVGGMEYIVHQLQSETYEKLYLVIGMVNDKDVASVLELLPQKAVYYFTQASVERALDATILKEKAAEYGLKGQAFSTVKEALNAAKAAATENDFIFVGGSTFVVADALGIEH